MDCNRTLHLTRDRTGISVSSPGFPHQYPPNIHCYTVISAPPNYRIIVDFEELVIENEPQYVTLHLIAFMSFNPIIQSQWTPKVTMNRNNNKNNIPGNTSSRPPLSVGARTIIWKSANRIRAKWIYRSCPWGNCPQHHHRLK